MKAVNLIQYFIIRVLARSIGRCMQNKRIIAVLLILTFNTVSFLALTQVPQKMSYQAVVRNASGNLIGNGSVGMKISILQGSASGTTVYSETHALTTNTSGLVTVEIGGGTILNGNFANINWAGGTCFLKTEIDPTGGINYTVSGVSQLLTVPFAFYAKTADNGITPAQTEAIVANSAKISYPEADAAKLASIDGSETKLTAGDNVSISGVGTTSDPYKINSAGAGSTSSRYVGELYQGGVVFYVDQAGLHGLICSMVDINIASIWSDVSSFIGPSCQSDWNGQGNTNAIVAQSTSTSAADMCEEYTNEDYGTGTFTDWYLPAVDELNILFNARRFVNKVLDTDSNSATTGITKNNYWSSSENAGSFAWVYSFITGNPNVSNKNLKNYVRAIRAF